MWGHRRRRSTESTKDSSYRIVNQRIYSISQRVKAGLSTHLVAQMDGLPLYNHLFGDISPVMVTIQTTRELARFANLVIALGEDVKPYRDLVGVAVNRADNCCVNIPVSTAAPFYWLSLKSSAPVHRLGTFCRIGSPPGFYVGEEALRIFLRCLSLKRAATFDSQLNNLVAYCRSALAEVYGADYLEKVDRVITINDRIGTLDTRVLAYAKSSVHSPGALYKMLPALSSLVPNLSVKHVTITRLAKPPDHQLIEDLNLLANLNTVTEVAEETEE
jgi:hypothetical protein